MKKIWLILCIVGALCSFCIKNEDTPYKKNYIDAINDLEAVQLQLLDRIKTTDLTSVHGRDEIRSAIKVARHELKDADIWLRYLEPVSYKKINGPLPVEWENEVFEKFEKPYRREGAGLTLAELYLNEKMVSNDSLTHLIQRSIAVMPVFRADSITRQLNTPDHFFLCNRLYLLNLASIYTTGFECPDVMNIIPELRSMMSGVRNIYTAYDQSFPSEQVTKQYLELYDKAIAFVNSQSTDYEQFDHFTFIKDYVNPLFAANQVMIRQYKVVSISVNDYTLTNTSTSIFDKGLYTAQNIKGVYALVDDKEALAEIRSVGKLLFYDPLLSGNDSRSCASCHKNKEYFTDTILTTSLNFDRKRSLSRNTPSLINVVYDHLLMLDGKHLSLQAQAQAVMTNPDEMGGDEKSILAKVLSCKEYKTAFRKFLKLTPEIREVTLEHVISAITLYYGSFSNGYSPFDDAMDHGRPFDNEAKNGFNLFMSKAKCGTCHYIPRFSGVPAPYVSSEFEVVGTPADTGYTKLSEDRGRYVINPAFETDGAFRTTTVRNTEYTKPYMHNGVFRTMEQVIDFYDGGGAAGRGMKINNQTLSPDSLKLTVTEKKELIRFIHSLNENVPFEEQPVALPISSNAALNKRKVGGEY